MSITFHKEEIEFEMPDEQKLMDWLQSLATTHEKTINQLSYIFCSDDYLLEINRTYLNHDYYTDIITFPYKQGKFIESDVFISIDRIQENAQSYKVPFDQELLRVIAHGLLHLMGFKDKSDDEKEEMRAKENWAIEKFNTDYK